MHISPISFTTPIKQSFKGIEKFNYNDSQDDNAYELMVNVDYYSYYPFADETKEQIHENTRHLDTAEINYPQYPAWGTFYGNSVRIENPLPITKAQYENLKKQGMKDETILNIFL